MRYQVTVIDKKGRITLNTAYHEQHKAYDEQIADILGRINVHGVVMAYTDGSHTQFGPMEYECELCDSYAHKTEACPLRDEGWEVDQLEPDGEYRDPGTGNIVDLDDDDLHLLPPPNPLLRIHQAGE